MTRIDVLIPHYNDSEGLALSLRSVAAQDWGGRFRVVVADDGSAPGHVAAVEKALEGMPFDSELVRLPHNRGRPFVRNALLDQIDSPFVTWLDAGDEWYPEKTSRQLELASTSTGLRAPDHFWITCDYHWLWQGAVKRRHLVQNTEGDQLKKLLIGRQLRAYLWTLLAPAMAFKSVGWFDERLPRLQDLDYFIRFKLKGGIILKPEIPEPLCVYHKSDIGRRADQIRACQAYIYEKHRVLYRKQGPRFERIRLYDMERHAARFAYNNGDRWTTAKYVGRAIALRPLHSILNFRQIF